MRFDHDSDLAKHLLQNEYRGRVYRVCPQGEVKANLPTTISAEDILEKILSRDWLVFDVFHPHDEEPWIHVHWDDRGRIMLKPVKQQTLF